MRSRGGKLHPSLQRRKANWIGHILSRNCLLKQVIEGEVEGAEDEEEDIGSYWRKQEDSVF